MLMLRLLERPLLVKHLVEQVVVVLLMVILEQVPMSVLLRPEP